MYCVTKANPFEIEPEMVPLSEATVPLTHPHDALQRTVNVNPNPNRTQLSCRAPLCSSLC